LETKEEDDVPPCKRYIVLKSVDNPFTEATDVSVLPGEHKNLEDAVEKAIIEKIGAVLVYNKQDVKKAQKLWDKRSTHDSRQMQLSYMNDAFAEQEQMPVFTVHAVQDATANTKLVQEAFADLNKGVVNTEKILKACDPEEEDEENPKGQNVGDDE
jgi:putative protein kinase ArgK-like GTPase of G3E family